MDEEAGCPRFAVLQVPAELPRLLRDPCRVWGGRTSGEVDAARAELKEEEDVQALEEERVDGEVG
jgi:hypothetical protein